MESEIMNTHRLVIIVDDDESTLTSLGEVLELRGFAPRLFVHAEKALEALYGSDPIAVVTDLDMPDMSGEELCSAIRCRLNRHDLPVAAISGRDRLHLLHAGTQFDRRFQKPIALGELYEFLEECVRRADKTTPKKRNAN